MPLHVIRRRTPALAILAGLAVGMAMLGVLLSSAISGRMVSRSGNVKPYIVTGRSC
ncbi:hypothetical protein ACGFI3_06205 [Nonomuraea wenchangensis]|uniref:hypothetical protein n=1 Tax=Nonomuraea wenchangensis TaxID=568860 RepID=UPI00371A98BF